MDAESTFWARSRAFIRRNLSGNLGDYGIVFFIFINTVSMFGATSEILDQHIKWGMRKVKYASEWESQFGSFKDFTFEYFLEEREGTAREVIQSLVTKIFAASSLSSLIEFLLYTDEPWIAYKSTGKRFLGFSFVLGWPFALLNSFKLDNYLLDREESISKIWDSIPNKYGNGFPKFPPKIMTEPDWTPWWQRLENLRLATCALAALNFLIGCVLLYIGYDLEAKVKKKKD